MYKRQCKVFIIFCGNFVSRIEISKILFKYYKVIIIDYENQKTMAK